MKTGSNTSLESKTDNVSRIVAKAKRRIRNRKIVEAKPKKLMSGFGYLCGCSYCIEQFHEFTI